MSITSTFTHTLEDGIETYAFKTALHKSQYRHLVDRSDDGPWQILPLTDDEGMDIPTARAYLQELTELIEFAENLTAREIRRCTEPGAPRFEELAGAGL